MTDPTIDQNERHMTNIFEKYLTLWVGLCIIVGIILGSMVSIFFLGQSAWIIPSAIVSGLCAFFLLRFFIMASTSCWGALLAIGGFSRLLHLPINEHHYLIVASEAVLFTVGIGYQIFFYKKKS